MFYNKYFVLEEIFLTFLQVFYLSFQGSKGEKTKTVSHNWKFKIGSLRRESYNLREMEG